MIIVRNLQNNTIDVEALLNTDMMNKRTRK